MSNDGVIQISLLTREQTVDSIRFITVATSVWVGSRFLPRITNHRENRVALGCVGGVAGFVYGLVLAHHPAAGFGIATIVGTIVYNAHKAYVTGSEPQVDKPSTN